MNETAEIIEINQEGPFKVVKFELTPEAIAEKVKEYNDITVIPGDQESYQEAHKAKMFCVKARTGTDKKRKSLGADARQFISDVNQAAQDLIAPLLPLEEKLKAMLAEEDEREVKIEQARLDKIADRLSELDRLVAAGQAYNLPSKAIESAIVDLLEFEISAVDFDTETERAEVLKMEGLETLRQIATDRLKFEAVQAEQEAEKARLEKERAEFHAAQVAEREKQAKADADRKAKEDAAAQVAAQEAEKLRKANEKVKFELQALENEKAKIQAEKDAAQAVKDIKAAVANAWDHAHKDNKIFDAGWDRAKGIDKAIEKKRLQADKKRAKLVTSDNTTIRMAITNLDVVVSKCLESTPDPCTEEGAEIMYAITSKIKTAFFDAEKELVELA